jgi:hypothetical protein
VLVGPNTTQFFPVNRSTARNLNCNNCITIARAMQIVLDVENPRDVPPSARRLLHDMEKEMRDTERDAKQRTIGAGTANERIKALVIQFTDLAARLDEKEEQTQDVTSPDMAPAAAPGAAPATGPSMSTPPTGTLPVPPGGAPPLPNEGPAPTAPEATMTPTATAPATATATQTP